MGSINVVFLDFDGVVNTPMWHDVNGKLRTKYNFPENGSVNNWQACQWLSKFCGDAGFLLNNMKEAERIHESQKYSQA